MIYVKEFESIYKYAKLLVKIANKEGKTNLVENYLDIIKEHSDFIFTSLKEKPFWYEALCAFTAVELYDNPNLPSGLPLMVANKMYYFRLLELGKVTDIVECNNCGGEGIHGCDTCQSTGEETCDDCDGDGKVQCDDCDGTGEDSEGDVCDTCDGGGELECSKCDNGVVTCTNCGGSGEETCYNCDGTGKVDTEEYVKADSTFYVTTDEELINILKSKSNSKKSISNIINDDIRNNPKVLFMKLSHTGANIEISHIPTIKDYENDDYITNITKIKNLEDISSMKLRSLLDFYNVCEEYFGN